MQICYLEELDKRFLHYKIEKTSKDEIEKNTEYNTTYGYIEATHSLNNFKSKGNKAPLIFQETNENLYIKNGILDTDKLEEIRRILAESLMNMIIKMKKYLT